MIMIFPDIVPYSNEWDHRFDLVDRLALELAILLLKSAGYCFITKLPGKSNEGGPH